MADFDELFQLPPLEPLRPANRDSAVLACAPPASAQIVRPLPELTTFSRRADGHQPPSAPTAARQQQQQQQHAPNNQQQQQRLLSARPAVAAPRGATQHHLPAPAPATQHQHHAKQLAQQGKPMARQPTLQQLFARAQCAGGRSKAETAQLYVPGAAGGAGGHSGKENRKALGLAEPWDELQERGAGKVMVWKMDEVNDVHQGEKAGDSGSVEQQSSEEELDDEDGDEDSSSAGEEDSEYHVSSEGSEEQEGDEDEDEEYGQGRGRSGKGKAGGVTGARKRRAPVGGGRGRTQTHAVMPVTIDGSVDPDAEQRGSRPPPLPKALLTVPSDAGRKPNAKPAIGGEASKVRLLG